MIRQKKLWQINKDVVRIKDMSLMDSEKTESKIKEQIEREKSVKMQWKEKFLYKKKNLSIDLSPKCHTATFAWLFTRNVRVASSVSDCSVHC